ncbi:hypothetical protein [Glycomyces tritici]|uniref:Uncharacterized protein n=1 Tax=Glycomyces tritici TaxID=2665176 RepID=A0ABT7YS06_9ACTN|nr:hypothetical protein [Glycomyces tritici]MDN3241409.1 hypothetical protein [Glycomyces tritici]MDN3242107.1 hypothetical protein [Glycomyces tritici]
MPTPAPWLIITFTAIACALAVSAAKLVVTRLLLREVALNGTDHRSHAEQG